MTENELQRRWASELVERARAGRLSRRDVLRRATVIGLSVPAIGAVLAACGDDDDGGTAGSAGTQPDPQESTATSTAGSGGGTRGGVLNVGALSPPHRGRPGRRGSTAPAIAVFQLINEYLIWLEPDFTLRPQLAESWTPEEDGQRWTVTLREGVTFSDGTPFDGRRRRHQLRPAARPRLRLGGADRVRRRARAGRRDRHDDRTVVFELLRPYGDFPYLISANTYNAVILKSDYAGDYTDQRHRHRPVPARVLLADRGCHVRAQRDLLGRRQAGASTASRSSSTRTTRPRSWPCRAARSTRR